MNKVKFRVEAEIVRHAKEVGAEAVRNLHVVPMTVVEADVLTGRPKPGGARYVVDDGVCGFASINVKPGTSRFARYLVESGLASRDHFRGGVTWYISDFNQSLQRKEAFAFAAASVLRGYGIKAYASSRMD